MLPCAPITVSTLIELERGDIWEGSVYKRRAGKCIMRGLGPCLGPYSRVAWSVDCNCWKGTEFEIGLRCDRGGFVCEHAEAGATKLSVQTDA